MRQQKFAEKISTAIWEEEPAASNPYHAKASYCHGYDLMELMAKCSYEEVLLLLFQGELPSPEKKNLLRRLMIAMINPGPRHPATRAAMNAGVGKSDPRHILPISLSIMSGDNMGAGEVAKSMEFISNHMDQDPAQVAKEQIVANPKSSHDGDWVVAAGFGSRFGSPDPMANSIAENLAAMPGAADALQWGVRFSAALSSRHMGWRVPGVAAATFLDMNFSSLESWVGSTLFQMLSAPGLLAHGLEYNLKPLHSYPFLSDSNYVIADNAKKN